MSMQDSKGTHLPPAKGRGTALNPPPRFAGTRHEKFDDGWEREAEAPKPKTYVTKERACSILSRNDSPDVPFEVSINPYRGCEHGCIYCYARPTHAYLDLSPGLDFETRLFAKINAASALREELGRPGYRCSPIALGANTDPYQPIEREYRITRSILEVLLECEHPLTIVTKNALVERDLDLLRSLAEKSLVQVWMSCATLDREIARKMEPRASAPQRRMETIGRLGAAGVPCGVLVAPVVPFLTDSGVEAVLERAAQAGASSAGYVLLRLPHEIKDLFKDWLAHHFPLKAEHVMSRVRAMREGKENDANFGSRMRGQGLFAELLRKRVDSATRRFGLNRGRVVLNTAGFRPPSIGGQLSLF